MPGSEVAVKRYVARLSGEEREWLETLIGRGKSPAQRLLKARILLKADVAEAGGGWSDGRIIDKQTLIDEIAAWEHDRNATHTKANWHFTTPNARIKLKHLYPQSD